MLTRDVVVLWATADARPALVTAIVGLEPLGPPFKNDIPAAIEDARPYGLTDIPVTYEPPVADPSVDLKKVVRVSNTTDWVANCTLQAEPARKLANLGSLPALIVTGQASYHARYDWCSVEFLRQAGVDAQHLPLEAVNITGNSHFMFMETNGDVIAGKVISWLQGIRAKKQ